MLAASRIRLRSLCCEVNRSVLKALHFQARLHRRAESRKSDQVGCLPTVAESISAVCLNSSTQWRIGVEPREPGVLSNGRRGIDLPPKD